MNLDYKRLCVADVKRVSLRRFRNAWLQIYQKNQELLRVEWRLSKVEDEVLSLREVGALIDALTTKPRTEPSGESAYVSPEADPSDPSFV